MIQAQQQRHGVCGRDPKPVVLVKASRTVMQCVYEQGACPDQFRYLNAALQGVLKQRAAQLLTLSPPVNCQPS